MHTLFDL